MRVLKDINNTLQPDADYLKGNIRNKDTGLGLAGTPVIEEVYGDIIQLFQKLTGLAGIVENDLGDNETNGFQLIAALDFNIEAVARTLSATTTLKGVVEKATVAEAQAGTAEKYLDAELLQQVTATETRKGIQENATDAEAEALTATDKTVTPANLAQVIGGVLTATLEIGIWNMDTTPSIQVSIGAIPFAKIIGVIDVLIISDTATFKLPLTTSNSATGVAQGSIRETSSLTDEITLTRLTGGDFDSAAYVGVGNRGYLTIKYLP